MGKKKKKRSKKANALTHAEQTSSTTQLDTTTVASYSRADVFQQQYEDCPNVINFAGGGTNTTVNINAPVPEKDEVMHLQIRLKQRFLEECPLQNLPWLPEKKIIDDRFVDLAMERTCSKGNRMTDSKILLEDIFKQFDSKRHDYFKDVMITGDIGNGKSTLCWHLAREWANGKEYLKQFDIVFVIPLRQLRSLTIQGYILKEYAKHEAFDILEIMKSKKLLLILDGLDEVLYEDKILNEVVELNQKFLINIILTSRPINNHVTLEYFLKLKLNGFDLNGVDKFLECYFEGKIGLNERKAIKTNLFQHRKMKELSHCPLFLMLFCLLIESNPSSYRLPETQTELFKQIINFVVGRFYSKLSIETNLKLDLFHPADNKYLRECLKNCINFGLLAWNGIHIRQQVFSQDDIEEYECDLLIKLGFLLRTDDYDETGTYQVFHASFLEFFISFYLKYLFFSDNIKFKSELSKVLQLPKYNLTSSVIVYFLFGLMEEKVTELIREIPFAYFHTGKIQLSSVMRECIKYKEDIWSLFYFILSFRTVSVVCRDEGIQIFSEDYDTNQSFKSYLSLKNTSFMTDKKDAGCFCEIQIHSELNLHQPNQYELNDFQCRIHSEVSLKFINDSTLNDRECDHSWFTRAQLHQLVENVFHENKYAITISFCHCETCDLNLLQCLICSKSSQLQNVTLLKHCFSEKEMKTISEMIERRHVKKLQLICDRSDVNEATYMTCDSLDPIFTGIRNKVYPFLRSIIFVDVLTSQSMIDKLLLAADECNLFHTLNILYSKWTEYFIDISTLFQNHKGWTELKFRNLEIIFTDQREGRVESLSLTKCKIDEFHLEQLFCLQIEYFHYDYELINSPDFYNLCFILRVMSYKEVTIEGTFASFCNRSSLKWNLRHSSIDLQKSQENFISSLKECEIKDLTIEFNLHSKEYLEQLKAITNCLSNTILNHSQQSNSNERIKKLYLFFYPDVNEYGIKRKERFLKMEEISLLADFLQKFQSFVSTGVIQILVIKLFDQQNMGQQMRLYSEIKQKMKLEDDVVFEEIENYSSIIIYRPKEEEFETEVSSRRCFGRDSCILT